MVTKLQLHLSKVFLLIFLRDRQFIFFSLFFPIIFMTVFGFINRGGQEAVRIGIVNESSNEIAIDFIHQISSNPLFAVTEGAEPELRDALIAGDQTLVLVLPSSFSNQSDGTELRLLVDAAQVQQLGLIMPVLEQTLISIEREFRDIEPMFTLDVEDVQPRLQRYIDFLLPGLMAFTLMQLSIAGSSFNIVEYRRKGILKRLFVTPHLSSRETSSLRSCWRAWL